MSEDIVKKVYDKLNPKKTWIEMLQERLAATMDARTIICTNNLEGNKDWIQKKFTKD